MSWIIPLLTLALTLTVHEGGHFAAMKLCHWPVDEFSIGIGPPLFQRRSRAGTTYSLRLLLFAGYVRVNQDFMLQEEVQQPWYKRVFIYVAGMLANVLIAFICLMCLGDGLRDSFTDSFVQWLQTPVEIVQLLIQAPARLAHSMTGPVGIVGIIADNSSTFEAWLRILVSLNVGVAGINLMPIPVLDGGRIALIPFERFMGKYGRVGIIAFSLVVMLILTVMLTYQDILHLRH